MTTNPTAAPPAQPGNSSESTVNLSWLRDLIETSLIRSGVYHLPWSAEQEPRVLATWMRTLSAAGVTRQMLPTVLKSAHESRPLHALSKPITLDHVVYTHQRLQAGMKWSFRFEKWVDDSGDFYAPPVTGG